MDAFLAKNLRGKDGSWGSGGKETISGQRKGTWWKFGSTPDAIAPSANALFKSAMAGHYRMMVGRGVGTEEALNAASTYATQDVEMVGAYGWSRQGRETDMLTVVNRINPARTVGKAQLADALNSLIAETHKRNSPGELADVQIVMAPDDKDGKQNLIVTARNENGTYMMPVYINSDMIYKQVLAREEAKVNESKGLEFGPKITYKPAEGAPSIYASPDEWAKYRELQRTRSK